MLKIAPSALLVSLFTSFNASYADVDKSIEHRLGNTIDSVSSKSGKLDLVLQKIRSQSDNHYMAAAAYGRCHNKSHDKFANIYSKSYERQNNC